MKDIVGGGGGLQKEEKVRMGSSTLMGFCFWLLLEGFFQLIRVWFLVFRFLYFWFLSV